MKRAIFLIIFFCLAAFFYQLTKKEKVVDSSDEVIASGPFPDGSPPARSREDQEIVKTSRSTLLPVRSPAPSKAKQEKEEITLKQKYPQIERLLSRVPMTPEMWRARLERFPSRARNLALKKIPMPETAIINPDNRPSVVSDQLQPLSDCPALDKASSAISVNIGATGQIEDAINVDSNNKTPIPDELYGCTFRPYISNEYKGPVQTVLIPSSELKKAAQLMKHFITSNPSQLAHPWSTR